MIKRESEIHNEIVLVFEKILIIAFGIYSIINFFSDKEVVRELYIDLCRASIDKGLLTGLNQSKEDYINAVENGNLKYYDILRESIDIKFNGNRAYVIGKTRTLASLFGMPKSWWNLKQDIIMERVDGRWLIKKSIASTY